MLADHYSEDWETLWWVRADGRAAILTGQREMAAPLRLLTDQYWQYREAPPTGQVLEVPADLPVNNDLTITASFGYTSAAWARVVALLNAGRIAPGQIVTHRYPLERFAEGLAALESGDGARGKVMLEITSLRPTR